MYKARDLRSLAREPRPRDPASDPPAWRGAPGSFFFPRVFAGGVSFGRQVARRLDFRAGEWEHTATRARSLEGIGKPMLADGFCTLTTAFEGYSYGQSAKERPRAFCFLYQRTFSV